MTLQELFELKTASDPLGIRRPELSTQYEELGEYIGIQTLTDEDTKKQPPGSYPAQCIYVQKPPPDVAVFCSRR